MARMNAKPVLDTETGKEYGSMYQAGKDLYKLVPGGDIKNTYVWYEIVRAFPDRFLTKKPGGPWVSLNDPSVQNAQPASEGVRRVGLVDGVVMTRFVQKGCEATDEFRQVARIADALRDHGNTPDMQSAIALAHAPRAPSSLVQATFLQFASDVGFRNEATGLFADYQMRLRPDYFLAVGSSGILLEFERGKTITNNMDMLDFWKCHLCASAHYLFLLVPQDLRHGETGFAERPYSAVIRRLAPFFEPRNYTNVRAVFVFGY